MKKDEDGIASLNPYRYRGYYYDAELSQNYIPLKKQFNTAKSKV